MAKKNYNGFFNETIERTAKIGNPSTTAERINLNRTTSLCQIFEFYIPQSISELDSTNIFIERIQTLAPGSTLYNSVSGIWCGIREPISIFRLSVEIVNCNGEIHFDLDNLRTGIRDALTNLIIDLQSNNDHIEEALFFNDWTVYGTLVSRTK